MSFKGRQLWGLLMGNSNSLPAGVCFFAYAPGYDYMNGIKRLDAKIFKFFFLWFQR
jgi:hypothetical protein